VATLTGPGRIWLQSMSISQLAAEVGDYLPGGEGSGSNSGGGFNLSGGINSIFGN
jgi:hypothetical protein